MNSSSAGQRQKSILQKQDTAGQFEFLPAPLHAKIVIYCVRVKRIVRKPK